MGVDGFQYCVAYSLHLLLTAGGLSKVRELTGLLEKGKKVTTALHFKNMTIEKETQFAADRIVLDNLSARIAASHEIMELDEQFELHLADSDSNLMDNTDSEYQCQSTTKRSPSLQCQNSYPTRRNSSLTMISFILNLNTDILNTSKKTGNVALLLQDDELKLLKELHLFLSPLKELQEQMHTTGPTLSLIPLMKLRIINLCAISDKNDAAI